ncbi:hypothetical protein OG455_30060 [Kitasatospora sp. NBC_01287]|uniref:hypothetical protein n=1 Tax=Kitasatospora sp. NBC_01287 TaxID=2903573 RepID=UPI00225B98E7|nr:hypothetical protein [Kitasatospora sp. NBC_01287]MCX4749708.1 hypothetical protein [Kitasatospora sp. NBC_01287]
MTSLRTSPPSRPVPAPALLSKRRALPLLTVALCGLILAGAGSAAACDSANLGGALNSGFGNACVNGE